MAVDKITLSMIGLFFLWAVTVHAGDWYESMESATLEHTSYHNVTQTVNEQSADVSGSGMISREVMGREVLDSELQKEIASMKDIRQEAKRPVEVGIINTIPRAMPGGPRDDAPKDKK